MANVFNPRVWIIDTPATLTQDRVRVKGIRWVDATTAGHKATIQDGAARVYWDSTAAGANNVESDLIDAKAGVPQDIDGIIVSALQSGKLYIELG